MGKRMRPHSLTIPKPLIPVAGKPIVQRLAEDIAKVSKEPLEEIAFVIGDFGKEVEENLLQIAKDLNTKGTIHYQKEALGTAHAILCAEDALKGNVTVAFADTLFKTDFELDVNEDGVIWVHKVEDPTGFGVVKLDDKNYITDFIEKPTEFVSDLAIIGIYYFKDGENLRSELQYLIDNDIKEKGEYQLTNALENMKEKGLKLAPGKVDEWLDCGNKDATVYTNQRVLALSEGEELIAKSSSIKNSIILEPCYIGKNTVIENSVVGPYISLGENSKIENSVIRNSIIQKHSVLKNKVIGNSMIGNNVVLTSNSENLSIGDFSTQE